MLVTDFDFDLPERLIAQEPAERRDASRLLVVNRQSGTFVDSVFSRLPEFLESGDLLVLNNTRVFPARLIGNRIRIDEHGDEITGAKVEVFLVRELEPLVWEALVKPGKAMLEGACVEFAQGELAAEVIEWREYGRRVLRFTAEGDFNDIIDRIGRTPLPPYIRRPQTHANAERNDGKSPDAERRLDAERYQTVFAKHRGAIAAPTAGLHFTPELFDDLHRRGIEKSEITLHVGYGTFQPVKVERVEDHRVEPEFYSVSEDTAHKINTALHTARRIIAVGTTTTRALESAAKQGGQDSGFRIQDSGKDSQESGVWSLEAEGKKSEVRSQKREGKESKREVSEVRSQESEEQDKESGETVRVAHSSAPALPHSSSSLHPFIPSSLQPSSHMPLHAVEYEATDLFIYPGFEFQVLGGLVTNFHLPRSSLLMLVAAFAGRELILEAYRHAVKNDYRFYSYGDAMLIL